MEKKSHFEFFPKDGPPRYKDAFVCWFILGVFGLHQFYLGNKRRGLYLLVTGIVMFFIPLTFLYSSGPTITGKYSLVAFLLGLVLNFPVFIWDLVTLSKQVRMKGGDLGAV